MSFWEELKRRNVFKVGAAYAIVAWLLVQIANTFFPIFHMPDWTVTLVASLLVLGLPVTLIIAWAFELTPNGIKLTKDVPEDKSITHLTGQKLNYILIGVIVFGVAYILFDNYYLDRRAIQTEVDSRVAELVPPTVDEKETKKTIAVLPFDNLSSDPEQEHFVDGLSEELLNCLAQINGLRVTSRTSSFAFKDTDKTLQEVANVLGVEHILEGSVRKAGDALRITAQLIRVKDDSHLWSNTYDRELKDIFAIQEDIATAIADELKVRLGIDGVQKQLGGTDNVEAYYLYLVALGYNDHQEAMRSIDEALALDPEFALAWALKANRHHSYANDVQYGLAASELDAGLRAAERAVELEPDLADAHIVLGHSKTARRAYIDAELTNRKATELITKEVAVGNVVSLGELAMHYGSVGNLKKAHELIYQIRLNDPFAQVIRVMYILTLGKEGDIQEAKNEDKRCRALFGDKWDSCNWALTSIRLGADSSLTSDEIVCSSPVCDVGKAHFDSPEKGLIGLRRLYANDNSLSCREFKKIAVWAASFGDPEFALDAVEKATNLQGVSADGLWFPAMKEVRQLPRFKEFVREIGLVDYWNEFGWPDICRPLGNGDFECD
jgi:TolB-like protein